MSVHGESQYERELTTDYDVFIRVPDDVPDIGTALSNAVTQLTGLKKKAVNTPTSSRRKA